MSLSERDRIVITDALDSVEEIAARIILGGVESFARWLARELPGIFQKIRDQIRDIWNWIRHYF